MNLMGVKKGGEVVMVGKYELGRTLGKGNFAKVKFARYTDSGRCFAIKVLERKRFIGRHTHDQIKNEIRTLKLLKHPNVVRLYEDLAASVRLPSSTDVGNRLGANVNPMATKVLASKTKIYMVLEFVNGGELFDKIESKGRLPEAQGRKLFQQLIDAVSYFHGKGVFHRDLKPENVLLDTEGNAKISDFGLSALPQQFGHDGLLHTTCGSPNYVAPEVLANKGYDGATSDIWSCGAILYVILTGSLPFDDTNLAVLYQKILKGEVYIPKWLSSGARNMLKRILDPNPQTRIKMAEIKEDKWFKKAYTPAKIQEDEGKDISSDYECLPIKEVAEADRHADACTHINAFELIGMSSCLDLSGFFEEEDASRRKLRFTSSCQPEELFKKIEDAVTGMGFQVQRGHRGKLKVIQHREMKRTVKPLSAVAEVFELGPSLFVVELRKTNGDSSSYLQLWDKLSGDLGVYRSQESLGEEPLLTGFAAATPVAVA